MTSFEIKSRYEGIYADWEKMVKFQDKSVRIAPPKPLCFELPEQKAGSLSNSVLMGDSIMNEHRFIVEKSAGLHARIDFLWVMCGGLFLVLLILSAIFPHGYFLGLSTWVWVTLLGVCTLVGRQIAKHAPRRDCHIFDRDKSKLYLSVGKDKPHLELDFYDQFFYESTSQAGYNSSSCLMLRPRIKKDTGEFGMLPPVTLAWSGIRGAGKDIWYSLVRYMDESKPFTQDEKSVFKVLDDYKAKQGFKMGGLRTKDGKTEWL